ncbi:MAG: FAD-binding domain-containing protein [Verrucomicrobiota bacterium]
MDRELRYVSKLSPAIRSRLILEYEVIEHLLEAYTFSAIEKYIQEVYWRLYWKGWLEFRPYIWQKYLEELQEIKSQGSKMLKIAKQIESAQSGTDFVDYFMKQLTTTGYLHNHARMWFASYWIHAMKLPWQLGADLFYRHLLDADPASNTLSWRWVAGLQTKGKAYLISRANLEKFCDPEILGNRDYTAIDHVKVREGIEENATDDQIIENQACEGSHTFVKENERCGLWIHGEDLLPEKSLLSKQQFTTIVALQSSALMERYGISRKRIAYMGQVLTDALDRAKNHYKVSGDMLEVSALPSSLLEWALQNKLKTVYTMKAYIGPLKDELDQIKRLFLENKIRLVLVEREEDQRIFPYAKKGFFHFWKKASKETILKG